ncbi:MAG: nicotinate (nicotinamide) nucleotide adenylyltransferase, partial [Longimicrobiales bacterium]
MRMGVFGGTFDPPHIAHRIVAQDALEALGLDRVLFVPASVPPHKRDRPRTAAPIRLEMLRALLDDDARFEISTLELDRDGPSYTVDTLRALRRDRPGTALHLLIGADQWREFESWREPGAIEELARVCVLGRAGSGALSR